MTTIAPDIPASCDYETDVLILGAGPVGLMMANQLGQAGVRTLLVEKGEQLIDYPRAIGIDDEALRAVQSIGLIDRVLPHTTPWHAMRFLTPKGRCFADIQPVTDEFGWSRRNAFIQPEVDAILFAGLARFDCVRTLFSREATAVEQRDERVTVTLRAPQDKAERVRARWLVACDGGSSFVRRTLGISFEGKTAPNKWVVIDIANDPLSTPHVYMCCDPVRPWVSAALPNAVRRFEFMVMPGETEEQLTQPEMLRKLLAKALPYPERVELIRQRVYTHNARIAGKFREGRVLLAGDAAHIMPVWQGQGYNSGMRDAFNLAWKLALVVKGQAGAALLDSYEQERRDHAKAMIDLSVMAGNVLAPPRRWQGALRDGLSWALNALPPVKRYLMEMRFKPMPQYRKGALLPPEGKTSDSPIGRMFIQPPVKDRSGQRGLLDDWIGPHFAIIAWGSNPLWGLSEEQRARWQARGAVFIRAVPEVQLPEGTIRSDDGVIWLGDSDNRLRSWFARQPHSVAVLRPDRFVAATAIPQTLGSTLDALEQALTLTPPLLAAVDKVA